MQEEWLVKIPVFDLTRQNAFLAEELRPAVDRVVASGKFIMGENVAAFESEMAAYCGTRYAIGVASGTDALLLTLESLGVGPGDEVITSPWTFFATAEVISRLGAVPVFVDIDPDTFNLRPDLVEEAITSKTRAIIPVHIYGQMAPMDELVGLARKFRLGVIEDACQAIGAQQRGKRAGAIGDAGCFSFFPTKNLGCFGDGGLIVTNDEQIAITARALRVHGSQVRYRHDRLGYASRLDEIQAAVLRVKLRHLEEFVAKRHSIATRFTEALAGTTVVPPMIAPGNRHVFHQYVVRTDLGRDGLSAYLAEHGVGSTVYYPVSLHRQPVYSTVAHRAHACLVSEAMEAKALALPIWPEMDDGEVDHVAATIVEWTRGSR